MRVSLLIALVLLFSHICLAASPKTSQRIVGIETSRFNVETGEPRRLPDARGMYLDEAVNIESVRYSPDSNASLVIKGFKGGIFSREILIQFSQHDSARIFKDMLVNGKDSLLIAFEGSTEYSPITKVRASDLHALNESTGQLTWVGELVGPRRSYEEQNAFGKALVKIFGWFGRNYLNQINLDSSDLRPVDRDL